jgi:hypothetical protein
MTVAFTVAVPSVYGISTWKYVLAAIGLMLFVLAGRDTPTRPSPP